MIVLRKTKTREAKERVTAGLREGITMNAIDLFPVRECMHHLLHTTPVRTFLRKRVLRA